MRLEKFQAYLRHKSKEYQYTEKAAQENHSLLLRWQEYLRNQGEM